MGILLVLTVLLASYQVEVIKCATVNEPVNVGLIVGLPWDIANTLRAPFGGPASLLLTSFMASILLFGLLLAPVNYLLGYPPRIYHTYRVPGILGRSLPSTYYDDPADQAQFYHGRSGAGTGAAGNYSHYRPTNNNNDFHESFDMADILIHLFHRVSGSLSLVFDREQDYNFGEEIFTGRELSVSTAEEYKPPEFLDSLFLLVPEEDEICRQLMVCHAHGFLDFFPPAFLKLYKVLSKHFISIPDNYKAAIKLGLEDQGECQIVYDQCPQDIFHLTRGSIGLIRQKLLSILPTDTRDLWHRFYSAYSSTKSHL